MKAKTHFDPSIGNIRPKFLSTIFKKPKWCTTSATMTPIPANRKVPWARDAFSQENDKYNSMIPTLSHINPARNSSTRLFTAGLILAIFRFIVHSFAMGISDHQLN
jgi:hypothetical protein